MSQFTPSTEQFRAVLRKRAMVSAFVLLVIGLSALSASAQSANGQLTFLNNYFVTGDYAVGGVGLRGLGDGSGYATGYIEDFTKDTSLPNAARVPAGADVVAAFLYWETVETSTATNADGTYLGQKGFFRAVPADGVPQNFKPYAILGTPLGNPNAPVSWSSGGCSGGGNGSKTMRTYRADVRAFLPIDAQGHIQPNARYMVRLPDTGTGGATPLTLGATLVIIYRVLDKVVPADQPHYPLNAIVIYDGAYAPSNSASTMSLIMQGFYQPAAAGVRAKITHIAGNGQSNKAETVYFGSNVLPSPYTGLPPFPGFYNGSWDNPTWDVSPFVASSMTSFQTSVVPTNSNGGCVTWPAVIVSTTVQAGDDGLLNVWKSNHGYCDASVNEGVCTTSDASWVSLDVDGAPTTKDLYVQVDYLNCAAGTANCTSGMSWAPNPLALDDMKAKFLQHGITVHYDLKSGIVANTCQDDLSASPPLLCLFSEPGVVGWKGGFEYLKSQNFQHGRKDSYHYALFGNKVARPRWRFADGSLVSISAGPSGIAVLQTRDAHKLNNGDRVFVANAISDPYLSAVYPVTVLDATHFTIPAPAPDASWPQYPYSASTDPFLAVFTSHLTSASGLSDIGGSDSLITLGGWGNIGLTEKVQGGTFMHEVGHSLALTHGGYYYDPVKIFDVGANCKPNYLSIMNYLFQVDLLGPDGDLDYSLRVLNDLTEGALGLGVSGSPDTVYSTTKWYDPSPGPFSVGTPSKRYCDGTPVPVDGLGNLSASMYLRQGPEPPPAVVSSNILLDWTSANGDVNFDSSSSQTLRGFNDWNTIDLRQIGATGSDTGGGRLGDGGGRLGDGGGRLGDGGGRLGDGGGRLGDGGGRLGDGGGRLGDGGGVGTGELTFELATSAARPPRSLDVTPHDTRTVHEAVLSWQPPTFGEVDHYNVYRTDKVGAADWPKTATSTGYTDSSSASNPLTACTTYTYFVTAVIKVTDPDTQVQEMRESVASNADTYTVPCMPRDPAAELVTGPAIHVHWTEPLTVSGPIHAYNIYRDSDTTPRQTVTTTEWTDTTVLPGVTYTYHITAVLDDREGCSASQYCRESSEVSAAPVSVPAYYQFNFVSPLKLNAYSGTGNLGKAVPIKWQLKDSNNLYISRLTTLVKLSAFFNGVPKGKTCGLSNTGLEFVLFTGNNGVTGNSTYRYDTTNNQFVFNWDTTSVAASPYGPGCYTLVLQLDDGSAPKMTSIQLTTK